MQDECRPGKKPAARTTSDNGIASAFGFGFAFVAP
jgi:hypothetical protein